MISTEQFELVRTRLGHFASWAVWADAGPKPKDNIGDLTVLDREKNPGLCNILHSEAIFLGLNISRKIERPLGNFHDPSSKATDFKIRYALRNTQYWGAYMTDIIKDFEEKASGKMMSFLKGNRDFERENIGVLRQEFELLGVTDPLLVAFGNDAAMIAKRNFRDEFRIVRIPHYATYLSKENYRAELGRLLPQLNSSK